MTEIRTIDQLRGELRYSERLCQRTARLYRRMQTALTFLSIVGGSAAIAGALMQAGPWLTIAGAVVLAVFGGIGIAVRPGDKASQNEADMRRYSSIRVASLTMTPEQLAAALEQARPVDAPEIEPLRDVVWNDVVTEMGNESSTVPLRWNQRIVAALA